MENISNYPAGAANDSNAPWNEDILPSVEVPVLISITLSKTVPIKVNDYKVDIDEDGNQSFDFSETDLYEAVKNQIILPQDAHFYIHANTTANKMAVQDLRGWNIDEMEVMED